MLKPKPAVALGVGGAFAFQLVVAPFTHTDGEHHLPPGSALIVMDFTSVGSTGTMIGSLWLANATHDAEYLLPPDTTPLKSDGEEQA